MKKDSINLSDNEKKFLNSLLEDGSKTDSKIAEETGMSKSTANRIRKKLEKRDIISEYIPIVDLDKVGVDVFLVVLFQWKAFKDKELTNKATGELVEDPHVIFLANGEGNQGQTTCLFLGFDDVEEYHDYFRDFREKYEDEVDKITTLLIPSSKIQKHDFTHLVKNVIGG